MTSTALFLLLALALGFFGSICEPTRGARTPRQLWGKFRRTGLLRFAGWGIVAVGGALVVISYALLRGSGWGISALVAASACWAASHLAMDGRRFRVLRMTGGRA